MAHHGVAGRARRRVGCKLWRDLRKPSREQEPPSRKRKKAAVTSYIHGASHKLKKIVGRSGADLVFSAPHK